MTEIVSGGDGKENARARFDEVVKSLFSVSGRVLDTMICSLFEIKNAGSTKITSLKSESISDEYEVFRSDLLFMAESDGHIVRCHIEIQTNLTPLMVFRMARYGYMSARAFADSTLPYPVLEFPKQLVLLLEESPCQASGLQLDISLPDGQTLKYITPVMKFWEYDPERILDMRLYPLIPLCLLKYRKALEKAKRNHHNGTEVSDIIIELKNKALSLSEISRQLYDRGHIPEEDLGKMLNAVNELFSYLNRKYGGSKTLEEEVYAMNRTLYDPAVEERGRMIGHKEGLQEGIHKGIHKGIQKGMKIAAKKMLRLGFDLEQISEVTEISVDKIKEMKTFIQEDTSNDYICKAR